MLDENGRYDLNDTFRLYKTCSELLVNEPMKGRELLISILDTRNKYCKELDDILTDLVEAAGFYPYLIKENLNLNSTSQNIRKETNRSKKLNGKIFHDEQKKLIDMLGKEGNLVVSAPTSFGKSLLIQELVASGIYPNILVIQPTLALLDETRKKLTTYKNLYKIIIRTNQTLSDDCSKGNLFLLTAERVNEFKEFPSIDLLILDEFYKISSKRGDERFESLNNAFIKIYYKNPKVKFYFLGPNIDGITPGFEDKFNATFYQTNFSMVNTEIINTYEKFGERFGDRGNAQKFKENVLYELIDEIKENQVIVYCSSPNRARKLAGNYFKRLKDNIFFNQTSKKEIAMIEWINKNISESWSLSGMLKYKIAFHDGALPRHITSSLVDYFNAGDIDVLFCTSTIIEGVNTSAKTIVYYDHKKGEVEIDFFDYANIKGRAGRLMVHYTGDVYNFSQPPAYEKIVIDLPFYDQQNISKEIMINLKDSDIINKNTEEYSFISNLTYEEKILFKKNSVNLSGQIELLKYLKGNIFKDELLICWTQLPKKDQLYHCLKLCFKYLLKDNEKPNLPLTENKLCYLTFNYGIDQNINKIIHDTFNYKKNNIKNTSADKVSKAFDDAVRESFYILRHWFQYKIPKLLSILNELQRFVSEKEGVVPGNYSYYSSLIENDFIPENLNILIEYGLPASAIRKIERLIPKGINEDEVMTAIFDQNIHENRTLLDYEREILKKNMN